MNIHIETDRLIIRDIEESDAEGMFELDSNPAVHEFLGNNPIKTIEEARQVIDYVRAQYVQHGIGRWAIEDKATGDFVGWTGLKYEHSLREDMKYYDLGYRLRQEYWGKGIATETAVESLKYGFENMNLEAIGGAADVKHSASNRILSKIGLTLVDTFEYDGIPHNWYNIQKSEWLELQNNT